MFGKRLPGGPLALKQGNARGLRGGHLRGEIIFAGAGLELFQLQLELVEQPPAALGAGAVLFTPELGDLQLQVRDQGIAGRGLGSCGGKLGGHGNHQRPERFDTVRQGRNGGFHG